MKPDELRRLAEAATPGPWIRPWGAVYLHAPGTNRLLQDQPTLDYIVAADPQTILTLLDERDALRVALNVVLDALKDQNDASGLIWNMLEARDLARGALDAKP